MVPRAGSIFTTDHDAPVARPDSMRVLDATVTRRTRSGDILGPAQRVDVMTALKAMTIWAAYQQFEEGSEGSIEHGQLADEDSVKMMADSGAVWSIQPFVEALASSGLIPAMVAMARAMWDGTDTAYQLAIKHGVPTGWGSDILFDAKATEEQGKNLSYMTRWYTPAQALRQATADNAFSLAMSGLRNPYPGPLGVITKGAHADMLLVEGDPTEKLDLVADPDRNFKVIMKAGQVVKNTL